MSAQMYLTAALQAAKDWHFVVPELAAFCPWPDDLEYAPRAAQQQPGVTHLVQDPGAVIPASLPLQQAVIAAAPYIEWRVTYSKDEVGRDFLNRFCWFELAGPDGHFITQKLRMTFGYWGPGLRYDWHQHAAEELYSVVSGRGKFHVEDEETQTLGPSGTRLHLSEQRHALDTTDSAILTYVLWRGDGLADDPRMST